MTGESAVNGGPTGQPQDAEVEALEAAVNSFEQPTSVLPSVETNDGDEIPDTAANSELNFLSRDSPNGSVLSRSPSVGVPVSLPHGLTPERLSPLRIPSSPDAPLPAPFLFIEELYSFEMPAAVAPSTGESYPATFYSLDTSFSDSVMVSDSPAIRPLQLERGSSELQRIPRLRLVPGAPWFHGFAAGRDPAPGPFLLPQETTHRVSERGSSPDGSDIHPLELQHGSAGLEPRSDEHVAPSGSPHVSTHRVVPGHKGVRSCLSRALRKVASLLTPSRRSRSPVAEEEFEWRYSNLDQMLIKAPSRTGTKWGPIGPKRQYRKDKQPAYHIMSPSNSPSNHNRVEKAFKTTPIRRTRSSYAAISRRRRTEASGRIDRTLYRLPELLSQHESDGDVPMTANPTTPQTAHFGPPMTAPAARTAHLNQDAFTTENIPTAGAESLTENPPASPGIVRWAFNNISRRWTNIRDRYAGNQPTEAQSPGK